MNKTILSTVAVLAVAWCTGCATTKQYVPMPDQTKEIENPVKARIYVMRPTIVGGAIPMGVSDNETLIGSTGPKGYLCWERDPGNIVLKSRAENTATIPIVCEAGKVYYIGQHVRMGFLMARTGLSVLPDDQGKIKLQECKPAIVLPPPK
jgi:hypothetical protein